MKNYENCLLVAGSVLSSAIVYDAIILPGAYVGGVLTVEFILDGEPYICNVGAITFEPGHEYIYKVKITRTGVTATGTIASWTPVVKNDEVTAE